MKTLLRNDWANDVKKAINDFLLTHKNDSNLNKDYVVFDFDNTCCIFDSEETTLKHQLNVMAFPNNPISIKELLTTNLKNFENEFLSKKYGKVIISDWVDDKSYLEIVRSNNYSKDKEVFASINNKQELVKVIDVNEDNSLKILLHEEIINIFSGEITFHKVSKQYK